ncbi:uncharacterized protein [Physcomitrium patens]|uniref:Uncharacterized protein n=1 Tax=Physcomitrium patens TaxID=3218 RepID=A9TFS5_PHYPA|nr:uncharacterized protein LOC112285978 [Physcomitrium patens]XP_024383179.1 uncharacterized protein LOC112285978 [Physcomitrium patens]XP_024383180.1 uncharacterized protein LOC112285978 [Physcomitrium patens]PNR50102.1 hypothetical protein PHYPA_011999 [Physcomitrium patens]|eukprot:XP_024383178.1 uncharacterized protein LOC112285978 [Physcomitrella patens]
MLECKRHPSESQPSGSVCARCLEDRLIWLWRGKSFHLEDLDQVLAPSAAVSDEALPSCSDARPCVESEDISIAKFSAEEQLRVSEASPPAPLPPPPPTTTTGDLQQVSIDVRSGDQRDDGVDEGICHGGDAGAGKSHNSKDIIVKWVEFQARRRKNLGQGLEVELASQRDSPKEYPKAKRRSFDSLDSVEPSYPSSDSIMHTEDIVARLSAEANPRFNVLLDAQKMPRSLSCPTDRRSRAEGTALRVIKGQADDSYFENMSLSLPLGSWSSAEDTALRVIKEQADDMCFEDEMLRFGFYDIDHDRDCGGESLNDNMAGQGCFNPKLQSTKSPKWVKVLASPMTSRNRVFPSSRSKDDVRKSRGSGKRAARFSSSDWGRKEENDEVSQQEQRTVFSWLQDADTRSQLRRREQRGQRVTSSSSSSSRTNSASMDSWLRNLTTVGHLHEIAEELEIVDESSEEEEEDELSSDRLENMSSFAKFLVVAAQRQPKAGLTRLESAISSGPN